MWVTVLGRYGPFPAPNGACSSYLAEGAGGEQIVLDLGPGTLSRLRAVTTIAKLSAIVISHWHADHCADLLVLRYALEQLHERGVRVSYPMPLYGPQDEEAARFAAMEAFAFTPVDEKTRLMIGGLRLRFVRMQHMIPTYGIDLREGEEEKPRLFYTGDTGFFPGLAPACAGAKLLLADTAFLECEKKRAPAPHMTAVEVGALARDAGVKTLLCTHIWGGGTTDSEVLAEACVHFPRAQVAQELRRYAL